MLSIQVIHQFRQFLIGTAFTLTGLSVITLPAQAEGTIRIAEQFGIIYLPLNVIRDKQLIEKYGKAEGLDIKVQWSQLSGGPANNEALLAGSVDVVSIGIGSLFTIWDKTQGKRVVKGVASMGNFPDYLVSNNPQVKTIADFTAKDRIAVPAVGVSVQSRFLQLAAAKEWGEANYQQLDKYTVALPHPDAAAAVISGGTELTAHFSNSPFQEKELADPKVHKVLSSYDLLGKNSPTVLVATEKFRNDNPKTYKAFKLALAEAMQIINSNKEEAADIYIRVTHSTLDKARLLKAINNPEVEFSIVPSNTYPLAEFLHRVGVIKHKPTSWQDYFFADDDIKGGS